MIPANPVDALRQRDRHDRVLSAATAILSAGGEEALQMKDLAQRADVSPGDAVTALLSPPRTTLLLTLSRLPRYQACGAERYSARCRFGDNRAAKRGDQPHDAGIPGPASAAQRLTAALSKALRETEPRLYKRDYREPSPNLPPPRYSGNVATGGPRPDQRAAAAAAARHHRQFPRPPQPAPGRAGRLLLPRRPGFQIRIGCYPAGPVGRPRSMRSWKAGRRPLSRSQAT